MTLSVVYIAALAAGIYATRGIDSQTGRPVKTRIEQQDRYGPHGYMPDPAPSIIFEDGSAVYPDGSTDPENTWTWDCRTMGNRTCG